MVHGAPTAHLVVRNLDLADGKILHPICAISSYWHRDTGLQKQYNINDISYNKSTMLGNISVMEWNLLKQTQLHFTLPFDLELHLFQVNLMLLGHPKHYKGRTSNEVIQQNTTKSLSNLTAWHAFS